MSQARLSDFSAPWCQELMNSPHWEGMPFGWEASSELRVDQNEFWSNMLSNERGLRATHTLIKSKTSPNADDADVMMLVSLGAGLSGIAGIQHGGVSSTILDMITGFCVNVVDEARIITTAKLTIEFKRPVPVPSIAIAKAWIKRRDGRKAYVYGTLENGSGVVFAKADALYIKLKENL